MGIENRYKDNAALTQLGWSREEACKVAAQIEQDNNKYEEQSGEEIQKLDKPFRIGNDIYERIRVPRTDGRTEIQLQVRNEANINRRFPKGFIDSTPYYHTAVNIASFIRYRHAIEGCYNFFPEPLHKVSLDVVKRITPESIQASLRLIKQVFGNQWRLGITYLALLIQKPSQSLPVLCLVSEENQTGKSTFLNVLTYLMGASVIICGMADLHSNFNGFLKYHLVAFEEMSNAKGNIDKIKATSTAKTAVINEKYVAQRKIETNVHIVICSNNADSFITANEYDIRYWIIRLQPLKEWIAGFDEMLLSESESFFNFLATYPLPKPQSRMFFAVEDLHTAQLDVIRESSKSAAAKDLQIYISDTIASTDNGVFYATTTDLANEPTLRKYTAAEISKALRNELGYTSCPQMRFKNIYGVSKNGTPYKFGEERNNDEMPF